MKDLTVIKKLLKMKAFDFTERVDVLLSRARREEVQSHNEQVRQNKEMLKTISVSFMLHNDRGSYKELL